jgi:hypothetical protein
MRACSSPIGSEIFLSVSLCGSVKQSDNKSNNCVLCAKTLPETVWHQVHNLNQSKMKLDHSLNARRNGSFGFRYTLNDPITCFDPSASASDICKQFFGKSVHDLNTYPKLKGSNTLKYQICNGCSYNLRNLELILRLTVEDGSLDLIHSRTKLDFSFNDTETIYPVMLEGHEITKISVKWSNTHSFSSDCLKQGLVLEIDPYISLNSLTPTYYPDSTHSFSVPHDFDLRGSEFILLPAEPQNQRLKIKI